MKFQLDKGTAKQLKLLRSTQAPTIIEMAIEIGEDPRTFFEGHDWSGLDLRPCDLRGVSFAGAKMDDVEVYEDQVRLIEASQPGSFRRPKVSRRKTSINESEITTLLKESHSRDAARTELRRAEILSRLPLDAEPFTGEASVQSSEEEFLQVERSVNLRGTLKALMDQFQNDPTVKAIILLGLEGRAEFRDNKSLSELSEFSLEQVKAAKERIRYYLRKHSLDSFEEFASQHSNPLARLSKIPKSDSLLRIEVTSPHGVHRLRPTCDAFQSTEALQVAPGSTLNASIQLDRDAYVNVIAFEEGNFFGLNEPLGITSGRMPKGVYQLNSLNVSAAVARTVLLAFASEQDAFEEWPTGSGSETILSGFQMARFVDDFVGLPEQTRVLSVVEVHTVPDT